MKTTTKTNNGDSKKNSFNGKLLSIRGLSSERETARFNELCGKFNYMGEGRPAGDTLRMVVECDGEWVALLLWGSAAYRLKDRDEFIGWNNAQRAARQKLVVQNRRFVILAEPGERPNFASKVLGMVIRELADHETGVPVAMIGSSQGGELGTTIPSHVSFGQDPLRSRLEH
jgi:hypothetical protein